MEEAHLSHKMWQPLREQLDMMNLCHHFYRGQMPEANMVTDGQHISVEDSS